MNCLMCAGSQTCILRKSSKCLLAAEPSLQPIFNAFISWCLYRGQMTTSGSQFLPSTMWVGVGVGTQVVRLGTSAFSHRVISLAQSSSFCNKSGAFWEVPTNGKELGCQRAEHYTRGRAGSLSVMKAFTWHINADSCPVERDIRGARPGHRR